MKWRSRHKVTVNPDENQGTACHGKIGESDTGAELREEHQASLTLKEDRHLTEDLMTEICSKSNLRRAYKQVKRNKGSAGVDGMTVDDMHDYFKTHIDELIAALLDGSYRPQKVLGIHIPKPGGGSRELGIPTVIDRVVQQAITQILEKAFEPTFSESSYGFRPKRSGHDALKRASAYVKEGKVWVVDLDLEKFFDRVNHDILMRKLSKRIGDKRLLRLIRRYLTTGIMMNGLSQTRQEGTPQGSPLSPLLSNIMLDGLDKALERRGHRFCRYADDCNIYVQSQRAGHRVMESVTQFLEQHLKLKVNTAKSAVALVNERKFLGYRLQKDGHLSIAPESLQRLKDKLRERTKRNRGRSFELIVREINQTLRGWVNYFILSESRSRLRSLDSWLRRKLRCYRLKQRKKYWSIVTWLRSLGVAERDARKIGASGKGWWCLSKTPALHRALNQEWFRNQGLLNMETYWESRRVKV
jgi:RNA-directed DNA polymerase